MRTLVIDTAFYDGRVGVCDSGNLLCECTVPAGCLEYGLFDAIINLGVQRDFADIDLIVITQGPGSFTGLKIGATLVKTLGFTLSKPFKGVSTLEWLAAEAGAGTVLPIIRSHADRYYWGMYQVDAAGEFKRPVTIAKPQCNIPEEIISMLHKMNLPIPDLAIYSETETRLPEFPWGLHPVKLSLEILCRLGELSFAADGPDDPVGFTPTYIARSQAEEKAGGEFAEL